MGENGILVIVAVIGFVMLLITWVQIEATKGEDR